MHNVRTINLAVVSRRDLYYVSENESFGFGQNIWISRSRARLGLLGVGVRCRLLINAQWISGGTKLSQEKHGTTLLSMLARNAPF